MSDQNKNQGFGVVKDVSDQLYDILGEDSGLSLKDFRRHLSDRENSVFAIEQFQKKGGKVDNFDGLVNRLMSENAVNAIPSDFNFQSTPNFMPTVENTVEMSKDGTFGDYLKIAKAKDDLIGGIRKEQRKEREERERGHAEELKELATKDGDWMKRWGSLLAGGYNVYGTRVGMPEEDQRNMSLESTAAELRSQTLNRVGDWALNKQSDTWLPNNVNFERLSKSLVQKGISPETLTMGVASVLNDRNVRSVLNKFNEHDGDEEKLSKSEREVLDAYLLQQASMMLEVGNYATAGNTIAEAIPYIVEMALTGGIGSFIRVGTKKALEAGARSALKGLGVKTLRGSLTGRGLSYLGSKTAGLVGYGVEGLLRSPFQMTTYADVLDRKTGTADLRTTEDGKGVEYFGQKDAAGWGEAIGKAVLSKGIENFTEMGAIPLFKGVGGVFRKTVGGIVGKVAAKSPKIAGMVSKIGDFNKFVSGLRNGITKYMEGNPAFTKKMRETFGIGNVFEEWTEEQLATVLHTIHGEGRLLDLIDGDQQAVILLSTLGMMGAPTAVNVGSRIKGQVDVNRKYKSAVDNLYSVVANPMEEMSDVRLGAAILNMEKATDIAEVYEAAAPVFRNENLDPKKMEAFSGFVDALAQKRAFEMSASDFDYWKKDDYHRQLDGLVNRDMGRFMVVRLNDDEAVRVTGGKIKFDKEGNIDKWMSDNSIYIERSNGKKEEVRTDQILEVLDNRTAEEVYLEFVAGYDDYVARGGMEADMDAATVAEMQSQEAQAGTGVSASGESSAVLEVPVSDVQAEAIRQVQPTQGVASGEMVQDSSGQERDYTGEQFDLGGGYYAVAVVKNADGSHKVEVFDQGGKLVREMPAPAGMVEREVLKREGMAEMQQTTEGETQQATSLQDGVGTAEVVSDPVVVEYPRDKDGDIDYTQIDDPVVFAQGLNAEFGDRAILVAKKYQGNAKNNLESVEKIKDPVKQERSRLKLKADVEKYDRVLEELGYSDLDKSQAYANISGRM